MASRRDDAREMGVRGAPRVRRLFWGCAGYSTGRAIRDHRGQLLYYEGTVEDITQQRLAEQKLRDSEALYHSK